MLFQTFQKTQPMQSKKILITGAAGFIGFHTVKRLSAEGQGSSDGQQEHQQDREEGERERAQEGKAR